jgi:hypothetical protein
VHARPDRQRAALPRRGGEAAQLVAGLLQPEQPGPGVVPRRGRQRRQIVELLQHGGEVRLTQLPNPLADVQTDRRCGQQPDLPLPVAAPSQHRGGLDDRGQVVRLVLGPLDRQSAPGRFGQQQFHVGHQMPVHEAPRHERPGLQPVQIGQPGRG